MKTSLFLGGQDVHRYISTFEEQSLASIIIIGAFTLTPNRPHTICVDKLLP